MLATIWSFVLAAIAYAIGSHAYARWQRLPQRLVLAGHAGPTLAASVLAGVFLIGRGEIVVQYTAGDDVRHTLWLVWGASWPALLLVLGATGAVHTMATLLVAWQAPSRRWLPITCSGAALAAFGLVVVFPLAPRA